jgi:hypothetical protein
MEEGLWRSDRIRKLPEAKTVAIRGSNAVAIELNPVFTSCGDGRQIGLPLKRIPSGAVNIRGVLDYDVDKRAFTRVDIVVLGDLYGDTDGNNWLGRPGRNPVGFAFELCSGAGPTDRLPPRGYMTQRDLERYLGSK